jgi:hypothetical protein
MAAAVSFAKFFAPSLLLFSLNACSWINITTIELEPHSQYGVPKRGFYFVKYSYMVNPSKIELLHLLELMYAVFSSPASQCFHPRSVFGVTNV